MSKERVCDVCNDVIEATKSLTGHGYEQYKVSIKHIEEGFTLAGYFKRKERLDVCPWCMKRLVSVIKKERGVIDD